MNAPDFIRAATACVGVKWRHQGRNPGIALDCIGLLIAAGEACGYDFGEVPPYGREPLPGFLIGEIGKRAERIEQWPPQAGDVLVLEFVQGKPQHMGIALSDDRLIHTSMSVRRVTIEPIDERWRQRIHSVWRLHGMEAA